MKKVKLKSSILASICALLTLIPNFTMAKDGDLKEITKPYLGVYECKSAQLGDEDLLKNFSHIHLELKKGGEFVLHYGDKKGNKEQARGKYVYDAKKQTVTLKMTDGNCFQRTFPLQKGQIIVSFPVGNRQLCLIFEQK